MSKILIRINYLYKYPSISIILKTIIDNHINRGMDHLIPSEEFGYQKIILLKDIYTMFNV